MGKWVGSLDKEKDGECHGSKRRSHPERQQQIGRGNVEEALDKTREKGNPLAGVR